MTEEKALSRSQMFYRYVIPSIGSMLVTSLYVVVDGIFVGRGIGVDALAAINLAGPYIMAVIAVSMMITVGGATMTGISLGARDMKEANGYFVTSMKMILGFAGIITIVSVAFPRPISRALGASEVLVEDTATYLRFFILFSIFFCASMALAAFVRNDGAPKLTFWGMVMGGVSNIFLDWLFIFPMHMGIVGPAIASGLGQIFSCALLMTHFIRKKGSLRIRNIRLEKRRFSEVFRRGTPEFMNQLYQPITVLCYNLIAIRVFGEIGVAAFSVVYYILTITVAVFIGLSQGIQPLISRSFGEGNERDERYYYYKGMFMNFILALAVYIIMFIGGRPVISMFNPDPQLMAIGYDCIRIYGLSFMLTAVNIVAITYFTSTKRTKEALTISALRCLVFIPVCVFGTAALMGGAGVWSGIIPAEILSMVVVVIIRRHKKGSEKNKI